MSNRDVLFHALKEIDGALFVLRIMIGELSHRVGKTKEMNDLLDILAETVEEVKEERRGSDSPDPDDSDDGMANFYVGMDKTIMQLKNSINRTRKRTKKGKSTTSPSTIAEKEL